MKHVTSSRRQIVMATLLGLAVLGAGMRYWAADPSLARDIGTLLLVLWLPAVGNLVAFLVHESPRWRKAPWVRAAGPADRLGATPFKTFSGARDETASVLIVMEAVHAGAAADVRNWHGFGRCAE